MKTLLLTILFGVATASSGYCKPGGWFFDILERSNFTVNSGYCAPAPGYYQQPVYYQQPRVIYYQQPTPTYYQPAPVYYQRPYYHNHYQYSGRHCD